MSVCLIFQITRLFCFGTLSSVARMHCTYQSSIHEVVFVRQTLSFLASTFNLNCPRVRVDLLGCYTACAQQTQQQEQLHEAFQTHKHK